MAADRRRKNVNWFAAGDDSQPYEEIHNGVLVALLMDIRDELQAMNRVLACPNFLAIPHTLASIKRNTTKPRKRKKVKRS